MNSADPAASVVAEAVLLPPPNRPLPVRDAYRGTPCTGLPKRSLAVTAIELPEATAAIVRT